MYAEFYISLIFIQKILYLMCFYTRFQSEQIKTLNWLLFEGSLALTPSGTITNPSTIYVVKSIKKSHG